MAGILVRSDGAPRFMGGIPVSGDHFIRDVAHGLRVSFEDSAHLKAALRAALSGEGTFLSVPSNGYPHEARRRLPHEILETRAEELFVYVQQCAGAKPGWREEPFRSS